MREKTKRIWILTLLFLTIFINTTGCKEEEASIIEKKPEITQIRSICELATLDCYYHNVAQSEKTPEKGITHIFEETRKFWIEYSGTVKLGIEFSEVEMKLDGNNIEIKIPEAKVLDVSVDLATYNEDSFYKEQPGINENVITASDAEAAVQEATNNMKETAKNNKGMLNAAQARAKAMIKNYVEQLGEACGVEYEISWIYE